MSGRSPSWRLQPSACVPSLPRSKRAGARPSESHFNPTLIPLCPTLSHFSSHFGAGIPPNPGESRRFRGPSVFRPVSRDNSTSGPVQWPGSARYSYPSTAGARSAPYSYPSTAGARSAPYSFPSTAGARSARLPTRLRRGAQSRAPDLRSGREEREKRSVPPASPLRPSFPSGAGRSLFVHFPQRRALAPLDRALRARGRATLRAIRRGAQSRAPDLRSGREEREKRSVPPAFPLRPSRGERDRERWVSFESRRSGRVGRRSRTAARSAARPGCVRSRGPARWSRVPPAPPPAPG